MQTILNKLNYVLNNWDNLELEVKGNNLQMIISMLSNRNDQTTASILFDYSKDMKKNDLAIQTILMLVKCNYQYMHDLKTYL